VTKYYPECDTLIENDDLVDDFWVWGVYHEFAVCPDESNKYCNPRYEIGSEIRKIAEISACERVCLKEKVDNLDLKKIDHICIP
jgi:hypothetical protein